MQLSNDEWTQLQQMHAGQNESPESPLTHAQVQDSDSSSPNTARGIWPEGEAIGMTPLAHSGNSLLSSSARQAQAFLKQRHSTHTIHKPALHSGELLQLDAWVHRNAHEAGDAAVEHTLAERAFATNSIRAAMGVDEAMMQGAIPRSQPKAVSAQKAFQMAKTLRGASCAPPSPDANLAARSAHKTALYTQALYVKEPTAVRLTPRAPTEKGYPPILKRPADASGGALDTRYGVTPDEATRRQVVAQRATLAAKSLNRAPHHSASSPGRDHFAAQAAMRGGGGGAPGPVPSPMLLPSPSGPILATSLAAPNSFVAPNLSMGSMP
jgi:hypothetical protein